MRILSLQHPDKTLKHKRFQTPKTLENIMQRSDLVLQHPDRTLETKSRNA
jgi:hypothetical protein